MEVTFVANSRIMGYRPGQVVKIDSKNMSTQLKALLAKGRHLTLLDPMELDEKTSVKSEVVEVADPQPEKVESSGRKGSGNSKKRGPFDRTDNGHEDSTGNGGSEEGTSEYPTHRD